MGKRFDGTTGPIIVEEVVHRIAGTGGSEGEAAEQPTVATELTRRFGPQDEELRILLLFYTIAEIDELRGVLHN